MIEIIQRTFWDSDLRLYSIPGSETHIRLTRRYRLCIVHPDDDHAHFWIIEGMFGTAWPLGEFILRHAEGRFIRLKRALTWRRLGI